MKTLDVKKVNGLAKYVSLPTTKSLSPHWYTWTRRIRNALPLLPTQISSPCLTDRVLVRLPKEVFLLKKPGNALDYRHKSPRGGAQTAKRYLRPLSENPKFMAIIQCSRESYRKHGGITTEEMARRLGVNLRTRRKSKR